MKQMLPLSVVFLMVSGCAGGPSISPAAPSATSAAPFVPTPVPKAPTPVPGAPLANLQISEFQLVAGEIWQGYYWYRPRLTVREVDGKSAALIKRVTFSLPGNDSFYFEGPAASTGCFLGAGSDRIPAGGTWNVDQVYYYCLDISSRIDLTGQVSSVAIVFTDEDGHQGTLTGPTR